MLRYLLSLLLVTVRNLWRGQRRKSEWVALDLSGSLPEFAAEPPWWQRRFLGARAAPSLNRLRRQLERIAADPDARGVLLRIDGLRAGAATVDALAAELALLRQRGKPSVAYLRTPDRTGYLAALAADQIIAPPAAYWRVLGVRLEVQMLADALANFGVQAELTAVSNFKSAGEPFIRTQMSAESRAQLERLAQGRYDRLVETIVARRELTAARAAELIDAPPVTVADAVSAGLLDAALYEDELEAWLAALAGAPENRTPLINDWPVADRLLPLLRPRRPGPLVGVVVLEGAIVSGSSRRSPLPLPLVGGLMAGADDLTQALRQAERTKRVRAIVLYVNSGGGDVLASDLIWREVQRLRRQKPVVVAMGDACASGGYYLAAPASALFAQPGTITGSIGVFSLRFSAAGLLALADVHTEVISRGARSGLLSATEPLSAADLAQTRAEVQAMYAAFKERVCAGRGMAEAALEPLADGRVWTGTEALAHRLVDELGGLPEALVRAQTLAGLPPDRSAPLLLLRGGRTRLAPELPRPATLLELAAELAEAGLPRYYAALDVVGLTDRP